MFKTMFAMLCCITSTVVGQQVITASSQINQQANTATARSGTALATMLSVNLTDVTMRTALDEISNRSGVPIVYSHTTVPVNRRVSVRGTNITLGTALRQILKGTNTEAKVTTEGQVTIGRVTATQDKKALGMIVGKVTDAKTSRGISGASISVNVDNRGVVTGEDGTYRLAGLSAGTYVVSVRLVGYAKQTRSVAVGDGATINADFRLEPSASVLNEVVVTGTVASTELKAVPSAITVVTAKQIEERGITRIDQLFRGEIPGLFSLELGAGLSFDSVTMYSRGATQIPANASSPDASTNSIKVYVDGVELVNPHYLSQIDPKSIERIEILTGPQASTIYGAGAINGVMQVFTKRGSTVKPSITLTFSEGFAQNNFSSALSPSHQYDASMTGTEGNSSYSVGSGWNYVGAWTPGKQTQRTSVYGGGRYQSGALSLDVSARQGWTRNKREGNTVQGRTALEENGTYSVNSTSGLLAPSKGTLSSRTLGVTLSYAPFTWWSHQINAGSDILGAEAVNLASGFTHQGDTIYGGSQDPRVKNSQTYSSTLRIPMTSLAQATLTYGADHWRATSSKVSWSVSPSGAVSPSTINRDHFSKNSGVYVQGQLGLRDALFFTYGVRADWNPNLGEKAKARPGRYGVSYSRDFGTISAKLRGSYGRSIKPPADKLRQGHRIIEPNNLAWYAAAGDILYDDLPSPELGPEFQQGGEGGIELYFGSRGSIVITRYNQTVDGLITTLVDVDSVRALEPGRPTITGISGCSPTSTSPTNSPRSDGYCYFRQNQELNVGSIRNQGWEMQGSINTGPFTTRGTYSWSKSRVVGVTQRYRDLVADNQAFQPGKSFSYVPEHTWAVNVSYARQGTSVLVNFNGIGSSFRDISGSEVNQLISGNLRLRGSVSQRFLIPGGGNGYQIPGSGYTTANLNASQRFSQSVEATLQVTNLGNYYRNDYDVVYPTIGRQTQAGLRFRF